MAAALPERIDVQYQGVDVNDGSPVVALPDDHVLFPSVAENSSQITSEPCLLNFKTRQQLWYCSLALRDVDASLAGSKQTELSLVENTRLHLRSPQY